MDVSSQIAEILEQNRAQAATITALSTKVDELISTVGRVSAQNVRLSSEVQELRRELQEERVTQIEVSRSALPGGHWVWESSTAGDGSRGRWVWSLEKYKSMPPALAGSDEPVSLVSLPAEIFRLIFDLLPPDTQKDLFSVCMRLLELASSVWRERRLFLEDSEAVNFLCDRLDNPCVKSERITTLLLPNTIVLEGRADPRKGESLEQRLEAQSDACLNVLTVCLRIPSMQTFQFWAAFLLRLNPRSFVLWVDRDPDAYPSDASPPATRPRTTTQIPQADVDAFSSSWNQLAFVRLAGPGSLLLLEGSPSQLALGECPRRDKKDGSESWGLKVTLVKNTRGAKDLSNVVSEEALAEMFAPECEDVKSPEPDTVYWIDGDAYSLFPCP